MTQPSSSSVSSRDAVPFLDVGAVYRELRGELDAALRDVMESGWYILGPQVEAFEREFASYSDAAHCIGVGNGLEALRLCLMAWSIGPGDQVIVPAHTFVATWLAVTDVGATPVPVDVDATTFNIDANLAVAAVTPRTRAIVPVHLYGQAADMGPLRQIAVEGGLRLLEDAAQAQGARWEGQRVGAIGHAATFSFYPAKNLGAFGDGGAITTDDADLAMQLRRLRNYGSLEKYQHEEAGINSRLDELQAALLRVRLRHLDEWNDRRRRIAAAYTAALTGHPVLQPPAVPEFAEPVWHIYSVLTGDRARFQQHMAEAGISTAVHYPIPPHRQAAYQADFGHLRFPTTEMISEQQVSLPIGPHLAHDDVGRVVDALAAWRG